MTHVGGRYIAPSTPHWVCGEAQNRIWNKKPFTLGHSWEARPVLGFRLIQGRAKHPSLAPCMVSPASHVGYIFQHPLSWLLLIASTSPGKPWSSKKRCPGPGLGGGVSQAKFPCGFLMKIPPLLVLMPKSSHFRGETLRDCEAGLSIQARNHLWVNTINLHYVIMESESALSGNYGV